MSFTASLSLRRGLISCLYLFLAFCWVTLAHAVTLNCEGQLSRADYRDGNHLALDPTLSILSRKPELGSLESRKPGVAKAIFAVMNGRLPYFRWPYASAMTEADAAQIFAEIIEVKNELKNVPVKFHLGLSDQERFDSVAELIQQEAEASARYYDAFSLTSHKINSFTGLVALVQSSLFELFVSTLIDGERFWFHQDVFAFYQGPNVMPSGRFKRYKGEHELDIIVRRRDGKDLWVEVKNNAMEWTLDDYAKWAGEPVASLSDNVLQFHRVHEQSRDFGMNDSIVEQVQLQKQTRGKLGKNSSVDILLISKFPISATQHLAMTAMGIGTWPIYPSARAFLPQYFRAITNEIGP